MLRISIRQAKGGVVLARSVVNPEEPDRILLKRGAKLSKDMIGVLERMGLRSLWVMNDDMNYLDNVIKEESFIAGRNTLATLRNTFSKMSQGIKSEEKFVSYRERVMEIFNSVKSNRRVYCIMDDINDENAILFHAGNVCYIAMMIGMEAEDYIFAKRRKSAGTEIAGEFAPLGMGALLHDVGKTIIAENIRNRPEWELSTEDRRKLDAHPIEGYKLLKDELGPLVANVALYHHKNFDGSGYPDDNHEFKNVKVHIFSRVVALANAYDELTSYRGYSSVEALEEINCARAHHFDSRLLSALNRIVPTFSLGSEVSLSSGHTAAIIDFDPEHPFSPKVVITKDKNGDEVTSRKIEIDLRTYDKAVITKLDGKEVTHLLPSNRMLKWEDIQ